MIVGRELSGRAVRIDWKDGVLTRVEPFLTRERLPWVAPGFFDVQVNGYAGVDFNTDGGGSLRTAAEALWAEGCTAFLPTIITDTPEAIEARLRRLDLEAGSAPLLRHSIPGFHVEGPFISPLDGPRGAHAAESVCPPSIEPVRNWNGACGGRLRILTLSPEWEGAEEVISGAAALGIVVSIGHTAASPEAIERAVRAGATCVTHFGNGAALSVPRHPNFMWQQLAEDALYCSVIADGFHLPDSVLKVVHRTKGERMLLISDSTRFAGLEPGDYETSVGGRVTLTAEGRLHLRHDPRLLAGSAQSVRQGVERVVRAGLMSLADAWAAASEVPARLLNRKGGRLLRGMPADLVLFDWDGESLNVRNTFVLGQCVYGTGAGR